MAKGKLIVSKWKMTGTRPFLWKERRRFVKPGEVLTAKEEELPEALKPMLLPIEEKVETVRTRSHVAAKAIVTSVNEEPVPVVEEKPSYYWIKERKNGTFDIFSRVGKKMNELPLESREEAETMLKTLE